MEEKIRVAILEDHQSIIDGYFYRLSVNPNIIVVASITFGSQLEPLFQDHTVDVLILDISVEMSFGNPNPFPILFTIPKLLEKNPGLSILVVSIHNQPGIIRAVLDAGARGYIIKDDRKSIANLAEVIEKIHHEQTFLSPQVKQILNIEKLSPINLSDRQREILSMCASQPGASITQLAKKLDIAPSTMRNLLSGIYQILHVNNRSTAIMKAREMGIITPNEPGV